ncbi:MAG: chromosomal replication initiator protein DnaA [Clostridia bacterium]|nr:chromosomal replication initiator protein DnaA [Clostridia bacterium]
MDEYQNFTEVLLSLIRQKTNLAESVFNLWFADLKLFGLTENKAELRTPTALRKNILSTKYIDVIRESLTETIGFPVEIEFSVENDSSQNFPPNVDPDDIPHSDPVKSDFEKRQFNTLINDTKNSTLDKYTFDNFIVGESNKFACAACLAVAKEPTAYNPLFIYGHSGLGKTHLLYAVINELKKNHPKLRIVYKKSEDFMNELIASLSDSSTQKFKEKYRTADVLLIDDIQFIAGKESTQEEFFHTFSTLYEADKQIILTSDRPPKDIKPLEDRLRTRFEGGLLADVQPPSIELRTAIIQKKCEENQLDLSPELIDYMASRLQNNIRQIEGVIKKLHATTSITGETVTREKVDEVISIIDPGNVPTSVLVEKILGIVASKFGITPDDLRSKKKTDTVAKARHVAIYLIRNLTNMSLNDIGDIFSRDHSTVMSSISRVETNIRTVKNYEAEIIALKKQIKAQ